MARLVIFGCGGFGREVLRLARRRYQEIVFASDDPQEPVLSHPVIAPNEIAATDTIFIAVGGSQTRRRISERFSDNSIATLIAATAVIGDEIEIGEGSVFCDFSLVTATTTIGRHFQCNAYSHVAHDCVIGDFVTLASKVAINGNTIVESEVSIGCGAKIRNGSKDRPLVIGQGATIGMGAVVLSDVPAGATVVGNPARPIRRI